MFRWVHRNLTVPDVLQRRDDLKSWWIDENSPPDVSGNIHPWILPAAPASGPPTEGDAWLLPLLLLLLLLSFPQMNRSSVSLPVRAAPAPQIEDGVWKHAGSGSGGLQLAARCSLFFCSILEKQQPPRQHSQPITSSRQLIDLLLVPPPPTCSESLLLPVSRIVPHLFIHHSSFRLSWVSVVQLMGSCWVHQSWIYTHFFSQKLQFSLRSLGVSISEWVDFDITVTDEIGVTVPSLCSKIWFRTVPYSRQTRKHYCGCMWTQIFFLSQENRIISVRVDMDSPDLFWGFYFFHFTHFDSSVWSSLTPVG